ncbi:MAG TPA: malate dehydrogenase (quinone) [Myxococcota bacterium]|nr:malate dehydrogenase (quinone) [Myxococcota bacterium]HQK51035.1 malate dehydrogenase (quinone) [Myxococcota bacterium]
MADPEHAVDVAVVGGGIMGAMLSSLIGELMPDRSVEVFERLPEVASESSQVMNNAGTGHAANCELNYTPRGPDGTVDIAKALRINESFEISLQFWSALVERGRLPEPRAFLNRVPHVAFVWGEDNVRFLRERFERMSAHPMFQDMEWARDRREMTEWMPLVMERRREDVPVAATRVRRGTDVDFGALTRVLFQGLAGRSLVTLRTSYEVTGLKRAPDGRWRVRWRSPATRGETLARFVFLGAGGGALPLLQSSGIEEARGYGGFPVSGQWLVCRNASLFERHHAKVYGKAAIGAPPMSVPHLDTRFRAGTRGLLFGPFAGFSTRFLKNGSLWDLPGSVRPDNLWPMLAVARDNWPLVRYLVGEVMQSMEDRVRALRNYYPEARPEDWVLEVAGQRVQIIKKDPKRGGRLEFGTELVVAKDGSLAALLGASPGASTGAHTMLDMLHRCFPERAASPAFQEALRSLVPSYGQSLAKDPKLLATVRDRVNGILGLRD